MRYAFYLSLVLFPIITAAQSTSVAIHAHNDYEKELPFYSAFSAGVQSIEIDVFSIHGKDTVFVAHDLDQISSSRTLSTLYLAPLNQIIKHKNSLHKVHIPDLMIDLKTSWDPTLSLVIKIIEEHTLLTKALNEGVFKIIISGSMPPPSSFKSYPFWVYFDGRLNQSYTPEQLTRVPFISASFRDYSSWNGKGRPTHDEETAILSAVVESRKLGKPLRLWATPDSPTAWSYFMKSGITILNTDKVDYLSHWLKEYTSSWVESVQMTYETEDYTSAVFAQAKPDNIILMIGDGMGLAHIDATRSLNDGKLNMLKSEHIALVHTQSADAYSTDSAAGGSAYSTGLKTNNRALGVDTAGTSISSLMDLAQRMGKLTALITTDGIMGATPAAFYAHQKDRSMRKGIEQNLNESNVDALIYEGKWDSDVYVLQEEGIFASFDTLPKQRIEMASSDTWQEEYLPAWLDQLKSEKGMFLMVENGRIDNHSHGKNLDATLNALLGFDKAVGSVLKWIESNPNTLVIVTADHETGGLVIPDGDIKNGEVQGFYYSDDHTGISVPLFAFGAGAEKFRGVFENTEIHQLIQKLMDKN